MLVVAAGALMVAWPRLPAWTRASARAGVVYLVVHVRALGFRGGEDFFAYRISLEPLLLATPALVLAVVVVTRAHRWLRPVTAVLAAASLAIHGYGAVAGGMRPASTAAWERIDTAVRVEHTAP